MSLSSRGPLGNQWFTDLEVNGVAESLKSNVSGATAASVLYGMEIDNTGNSVDVYVKIYNEATYTVGSDSPAFCFRVKAGTVRNQPIWSNGSGHTFVIAGSKYIWVACVTDPGTPGTTSPVNKVKLTALTD